MIRVKHVITYVSDVDLSAYNGMTVEQAIAHEKALEEADIIELVATSDEGELDVQSEITFVE